MKRNDDHVPTSSDGGAGFEQQQHRSPASCHREEYGMYPNISSERGLHDNNKTNDYNNTAPTKMTALRPPSTENEPPLQHNQGEGSVAGKKWSNFIKTADDW